MKNGPHAFRIGGELRISSIPQVAPQLLDKVSSEQIKLCALQESIPEMVKNRKFCRLLFKTHNFIYEFYTFWVTMGDQHPTTTYKSHL